MSLSLQSFKSKDQHLHKNILRGGAVGSSSGS